MIQKLLSKFHRYEIRIRNAVNSHSHGNFRSLFRGNGLEFVDLRQYQYGDDVRAIDWNASSKGYGMFVKMFREERDQNVFFLLDVSGSQSIGSHGKTKISQLKEITSVLMLSALHEKSHVGMYCFSDKKEKYTSSSSSSKGVYKIISDLYHFSPQSFGTNIKAAIDFVLKVVRKKSIVVLISDFIDTEYEDYLKALSSKHDLIVIHLFEKTEVFFPKAGILPFFDPEKKQAFWLNSSFSSFQKNIKHHYLSAQQTFQDLFRKHKVHYCTISIEEDYVPKLIQLFQERNRTI